MGSLELPHSVIKPRYSVRPHRFLLTPCHSTTDGKLPCRRSWCVACFHTCNSQLTSFAVTSAVLSPNSLVLHTLLVNVNRTSELRRSLAGMVGMSPIPVVRRSHLNHISPRTLSRLAVTHLVYYHYTMYYPTVKTLYRFPSITSS